MHIAKMPVEEAESKNYCAVAAAAPEQQRTEDAMTSHEQSVLSVAEDAVPARSSAAAV